MKNMEEFIKQIYKQWLIETGRAGGVLVGKSIQEFFVYLAEKLVEEKAQV